MEPRLALATIGHAATDPPMPIPGPALRPRPPAKAVSALVIGFPELLGRPRLAGFRIGLGVVDQPQVERVDLQRPRKLVHRGADRPGTRPIPWRAHEGRQDHVAATHSLAGRDVVAGIVGAAGNGSELDVVVGEPGDVAGDVADPAQLAIRAGPPAP